MIVNIGKTIELDVNVEALPANALEHVIRIGLRNILMDSHAGVNAKAMPELTAEQVVAQSKAVAEKKLAALLAGEVRVAGQRATRASVHPVAAEMAKLATTRVKDALRAKGLKVADYKDQMERLVAGYTAKHAEKLRADAEAIVAANREAGDDLDLEELLG